jgi:hypothetical protein
MGSIEEQLKADATADGISCVVEGFGTETVGEGEYARGHVGDGERVTCRAASVSRQVPRDHPQIGAKR